MIIECINCNKKFEVNEDLIPISGRNIQCGSCGHIWYFLKKEPNEIINETDSIETKVNEDNDIIPKKEKSKKRLESKKFNFTIFNLLSFILVSIITFIALIIILDTFKIPLYKSFPGLEIIMFNFFETLVDINLFIKDLIR